ncbi:NAD(P)-binding protein [Trematosphaeria pertusa]|uniref:NAD(P)-binding protein n=1 Tax=Trematosphaeria pertusa TaxID=390896 RepID=A0A6A6IGN5_9PLEO|nr:NAD(P)-binding protein [Trematosphaeria pertusa]KAF2249754.1 NAD(P)-binding protein [Trematosphaeria pertusa]
MTPKVFLTGGTGYIGGSVLHTIVTAHPEYDVTVLLRKVPGAFSSTYPKVKIVQGDYDSFDVLAEEASKADIVVHNGNSDHEPSLSAIITGLLKRSSPGFLLHLSGTGIVSDWADPTYLGKLNPKIWSDIDDLGEISSLPEHALHRNTEKMLNATIADHSDKVNIAIMCPPDIYGRGRGRGLAKTWSAFVPFFVKESMGLGGKVFYYGEGMNTRSWVHIDDLMIVYLKVVEAAAAGGGGFGWGKEGYYFAGTQEVSHIEVAKASGKILKKHGVIKDEEPVQVSTEQLDAMMKLPRFPKLARYMFASNSRTRPHRAEKLFGYKGTAPTLLESLEEDIMQAVKSL